MIDMIDFSYYLTRGTNHCAAVTRELSLYAMSIILRTDFIRKSAYTISASTMRTLFKFLTSRVKRVQY